MLIIWALAGVAAFVGQITMSPEAVAQLPQEQQEMWASMPGWAWVAYAVAVFAGLGGALCLFLRKRLAAILFPVSLLAVLVQFSYPFLIAKGLQTLGASALIFPVFIIFMAALQSWLARQWIMKGWLQ
jgi:hypothetical protein